MPKTEPSRANVPAAATDEPKAATDGRREELRGDLHVVVPDDDGEGQDHGHVRHRDGGAGLGELAEPLAATDDDGAHDAAQEGVGGEVHRSGHHAGHHRHHGRDDAGDAGVEQHGQQQPDRGRGHEVRDHAAVTRDDEERCRGQQRQRDEQDGVVAVPQPRAEAPQPRQQCGHHHDRQQQPAEDGDDVAHLGHGGQVLEGEDEGQARHEQAGDQAEADRVTPGEGEDLAPPTCQHG